MDKKGEESWWIEIHGTCELEQHLAKSGTFMVAETS